MKIPKKKRYKRTRVLREPGGIPAYPEWPSSIEEDEVPYDFYAYPSDGDKAGAVVRILANYSEDFMITALTIAPGKKVDIELRPGYLGMFFYNIQTQELDAVEEYAHLSNAKSDVPAVWLAVPTPPDEFVDCFPSKEYPSPKKMGKEYLIEGEVLETTLLRCPEKDGEMAKISIITMPYASRISMSAASNEMLFVDDYRNTPHIYKEGDPFTIRHLRLHEICRTGETGKDTEYVVHISGASVLYPALANI